VLNELLSSLSSAKAKGDCGCGSKAAHEAAPAPPPGARVLFQTRHRARIASVGGVRDARDVQLDLSSFRFDADVLARAVRDLDYMRSVLKQSPERVVELLGHLQRGDLTTAARIAQDIGLREEEFRKAEGGFGGFVVLLAIGLLLVTATPTSITADPIPPPSTPLALDDETAADVMNYLNLPREE
jgi:hypothetical protein